MVPVRVYDDASKAGARRRRIAGVISTESIDRQGEAILQRGMDFSDFLKNGWYNDNHSPSMGDVLGWPESVKHFGAGEQLPDGSIAKNNCTWTEGYLSNRPNADAVWDLANDLKGTGRSLGFSIEGKIRQRQGPGGRVIGKASIQHVAVTHCPVNSETHLMPLLRSLSAIEALETYEISEPTDKALTTCTNAPSEREDLVGGKVDTARARKRRKELLASKHAEKSLAVDAALQWVFKNMPDASIDNALAIVQLAQVDMLEKSFA